MRVVVSEFMSLDGVVQAPGGPDEDTSGGFRHGGWSIPFFDPEVMGAVVDEFAERSEALLQGRRTYQVSAAAWPGRSGTFADWINATQKYVASDTLSDADVTSWTPTTIIRSADLLAQVSALRDRPGGDIYVYGSLSVARTLLGAGLVDEIVLQKGADQGEAAVDVDVAAGLLAQRRDVLHELGRPDEGRRCPGQVRL